MDTLDLLQFVQLLANLKVLSESLPKVLVIDMKFNKASRKIDVKRATFGSQKDASDGPGKEETTIITPNNLLEASMGPKLPLGSGRCLIVNNTDLWSNEKQRQFFIGDRIWLVGTKADEENTIVSLEGRRHPRSFRVAVPKLGRVRTAIWENAQYREYSSSQQWHAIGTSQWRFICLRPDQMLKFDEEDTPGNPRTVIIFDPKIVEEAWHITRHPDRLPDEHYIVVKAR